MEKVKLHQKVYHVYDVKENFKSQGISFVLFINFQILKTLLQDFIKLLVSMLNKCVAIRLFEYKKNYLHEVEKTKIFISFFISNHYKCHYVFNIAFVGNILNILNMGQYLNKFIPYSVSKIFCVIIDFINLKQMKCNIFVYFIKIFSDEKLDD